MNPEDDRSSDKMYGPWPWIAGLAFGIFLIWVMFALATGFA